MKDRNQRDSEAKAAHSARETRKALLAGAVVLFVAGSVCGLGGYQNHERWLVRQAQIPRFQKVSARVLDKGVHETRTEDRDGTAHVQTDKWIRFTCRRPDEKTREYNRLSLSGASAAWDEYQKNAEYDAYFDPVADDCVLRVDVAAGAPDLQYRRWLRHAALCGMGAGVLIVLAWLRKPAARPPGRSGL